MIYGDQLFLMQTIVGAMTMLIAMAALFVGVWQLRQMNVNIRRGFSPVLVIKPPVHGIDTIHFSSVIRDYPVVEYVRFELYNDGNGPAFDIGFTVSQGNLELHRAVDPLWLHSRIPMDEVHRSSLARGSGFYCFFKVKAGFTPPPEGKPLKIKVTCRNVYKSEGTFLFEAPTDLFSALSEDSQTLLFSEMKGF